jgi:hypothetical protein
MSLPLNPIGSATGPTGPDRSYLSLFPTAATGPVAAPHITSIEELMASHGAIANKEAADLVTLQSLNSPTPEGFRTELFQWASLGFPAVYIVKTFAITPPSICSDGVTRSAHGYVEYLLETTHETFMNKLNSLVTGIVFSYSYADMLRLHVNKK